MKFRWVKTCDICPEQYDVYKGCVLVAYVRFRCGRLTAFCPNSRGRKIYGRELPDEYPLRECYKAEIEEAISREVKKNERD